jgi:hypothetical protein
MMISRMRAGSLTTDSLSAMGPVLGHFCEHLRVGNGPTLLREFALLPTISLSRCPVKRHLRSRPLSGGGSRVT